jgi:hypothetical protein
MALRTERRIIHLGANAKGISLPTTWRDFDHTERVIVFSLDDFLIIARPDDEARAREIIDAARKLR